jgi:catechol 2,3-dioxygenase-like lactoylglutathione lyase family enzyme
MHSSRLHSVMIDCNDLKTAAHFWSGALGVGIAIMGGDNDRYAALESPIPGLTIEFQQVPEPKSCKSRVHLDVETDDIEAEVHRLEALGARRQQFMERFWVMEDPSGNEFCVVGIQSNHFEQARQWKI